MSTRAIAGARKSCLAACLAAFAGCGGTDGVLGPVDLGGTTPTDLGSASILVGTFQVRLVAPVPASNGQPAQAGYTAVLGKVTDGPTPALIQWTLDTTEGVCKLLKPRVPFCDPGCGGSAACVDDNKCQAYPTSKAVGTVTVKGVKTDQGATEFSMEPVVNNYQVPAGTSLPYPAFDEGAAVSMTTGGGAYAPFSIQARGIKPFDLTNPEIRLEPNQPVTLTWAPAGVMGISTVYVKLDISHHGGTKGMIECEAPDTGSLTLSASLLGKLTALGVAGFPTVIAIRRAVGSTVIAPGRVDLVVSADVEEPVVIPGLVSCTGNDDCAMGQTCQPDLTCK